MNNSEEEEYLLSTTVLLWLHSLLTTFDITFYHFLVKCLILEVGYKQNWYLSVIYGDTQWMGLKGKVIFFLKEKSSLSHDTGEVENLYNNWAIKIISKSYKNDITKIKQN